MVYKGHSTAGTDDYFVESVSLSSAVLRYDGAVDSPMLRMQVVGLQDVPS